MKELDQEQLKIIHSWLEKFELPHYHKNFHRNFSDGVLLAQILKRLFPKMVDMHNYPHKNSTALKMENWTTLNRKVLQKLGFGQTNDALYQLAKGMPGAIEQILLQIMCQCNSELQMAVSELNEESSVEDDDTDVLTVQVAKKVGDSIVEVPQKMIIYSLYEKALHTIDEKDRIIGQLGQKITHLENFLKLKTERIENLCSQLSRKPSKSFLENEGILSNQGSSSCLSY